MLLTALFLLDNDEELWLWQGWWPDNDEYVESNEQSGTRVTRWHAERRAAMETALNYWTVKGKDTNKIYLVWAGLEPIEFVHLFPTWKREEHVTELNVKVLDSSYLYLTNIVIVIENGPSTNHRHHHHQSALLVYVEFRPLPDLSIFLCSALLESNSSCVGGHPVHLSASFQWRHSRICFLRWLSFISGKLSFSLHL